MAHILTNMPPKAKKLNEYDSECPQLKIPLRINDEELSCSASLPFIVQRYYSVIMSVRLSSHSLHPDDWELKRTTRKNIVAVWRIKELKPMRMTF